MENVTSVVSDIWDFLVPPLVKVALTIAHYLDCQSPSDMRIGPPQISCGQDRQ